MADLNTCDFRVDSATICSRSLDLEVGLPRVQGHPVTDPQIESNGKRDPHRDFHFAESMRFTRIQEGIINLLDKPDDKNYNYVVILLHLLQFQHLYF